MKEKFFPVALLYQDFQPKGHTLLEQETGGQSCPFSQSCLCLSCPCAPPSSVADCWMCLSNLTAQESAMRVFRVMNGLPVGLRKKEEGKKKGHHRGGCCSYSAATVTHSISHGDIRWIRSLAPMARRVTSQVKVSQTCHLVWLKDPVLPSGASRKSFLCSFAPEIREELPHLLTPYVPKSRASMTRGHSQSRKKLFYKLWRVFKVTTIL